MQLAGRRDLCGVLDVRLSNIRTYNTFIEAAGLIIAPLVGAILGLLAVASEVDSRAVRLAWTQSITHSLVRRQSGCRGRAGGDHPRAHRGRPVVVERGDRREEPLPTKTCGIAGWDLVAYGLFMFALTVLLGAASDARAGPLRSRSSCSSWWPSSSRHGSACILWRPRSRGRSRTWPRRATSPGSPTPTNRCRATGYWSKVSFRVTSGYRPGVR